MTDKKDITEKIIKTEKEIEDIKKDLGSRESAADTYGSEISTGEFCASARALRERLCNLGRSLVKLKAGIL